jgi:hypothetical protein
VTFLEMIDAELLKHPRGKTRAGDTVCFSCDKWLWPCAAHKALSALRVTMEALEKMSGGYWVGDECADEVADEALAAARKEMER